MINKEKFLDTWQTVRRFFTLHHFAHQFPKFYFSIVLLAALAGYGFLLSFPVIGLVAVSQLFEVAANLNDLSLVSLSLGIIWLAVLVFSIAMSHHIFTIRFNVPKGVGLRPEQLPKLFEVIEDDKEYKFWPKLQNVLLTEQFQLEIIKTPAFGLPVWSKNTLLIGLPLMQTMPRHYFTNMLIRKLLQYSKGRNLVTNWLYQLRHIWSLYPGVFSQRKLLGDQIVIWFFRLYSPIYQKLSLYAAQQEELAADTLALREINDSDFFKTIEYQLLAQYFAQKVYMPMINDLIGKKGVSPAKINPFTSLPAVLGKSLTEARVKQWLEGFERRSLNTKTTEPTLSQRMHNIGHTKIRLPDIEGISAAQYFFGNRYHNATRIMDKVWQDKLLRHPKATQKPQAKTAAALRMNPAVS